MSKKMITAANMVVSNFLSDDKKNPGTVSWLKVDQDWAKDNKDSMRGLGVYRGLSPQLVLAILDGDQSAWRRKAEQAISEANAANAPKVASASAAFAPPPPPPANSEPMYFTYSNGVQSSAPVGRVDAMKVAIADPNALFFLVGSAEGWKKAGDYGLTVPPPPAASALPPPPVDVSNIKPPVETAPANATPAAPVATGGLTSLAASIAAQRR